MKETIFDLVKENVPQGKEGYLEIAKRAPIPQEKSFLNDIKDYSKTFLKGSVEGISRLGQMMGGLETGKPKEKQLEEQTKTLDEMFPTEEGAVQKGIRRTLRQTPSNMAFPGGPIQAGLRSIGAGGAGQLAEELGAPEWVQTATELTAFLEPDITKKLLEKGSNAELIKAARELGISDEALAPLLQSDFKQKWLSKITPRRGKTTSVLENTKKELSQAYNAIENSATETKYLAPKIKEKLISYIDSLLHEMPSAVRDKVKVDYQDLLKGNFTAKNLINFYKDVNHSLGSSSKQLSLLKKPIKEAIGVLSPELEKKFETINKLYEKFYPIAKRLEPNLNTDIMEASKSLATLYSVITGDFVKLSGMGLYQTTAKLSQQMLLNPRFQQLSTKMADSIAKNKFTMAHKVLDLLTREVKRYSPEIAEEMENISEEELKEMFSLHQ